MTQDRRYGTGERGPLPPEPSREQVLERNSIERLKLPHFLQLREVPGMRLLDAREGDRERAGAVSS